MQLPYNCTVEATYTNLKDQRIEQQSIQESIKELNTLFHAMYITLMTKIDVVEKSLHALRDVISKKQQNQDAESDNPKIKAISSA